MKEYNRQNIYSNYNRKNKWLGIIDYRSLSFLLIYVFIIITILKFTNLKLEYSIYIFIFLVLPVILIVLVNINNESAIDVLITVLKFYISKGIFTNIKSINFFEPNS